MLRALHLLNIPNLSEIFDEFRLWIKEDALWWVFSTVGHALLLVIALLLVGTAQQIQEGDAPRFVGHVDNVIPEPPPELVDVTPPPVTPKLDLTDVVPQTPPQVLENPPDPARPFERSFTDSSGNPGGGLTTNIDNLSGLVVQGRGVGPILVGAGGVGAAHGNSDRPGSGGDEHGFGHRDPKRRGQLGIDGRTRTGDRAVAAALSWLARHQMPDGRWSLGKFRDCCHDPSCTASGSANSDTAATALGLLPFLAAGQTHKTKGLYQRNITTGLYWLTKQQQADGDLRGGAAMYSHGLATIALCEAYGLTYDKNLGAAAQQAINYIVAAQNASGGWHYAPGAVTQDTSVVGWQIMSLKSGQMAGLNVPPQSLAKAQDYLKLASSGQYGGLFAYMPGGGGTATMTSVGLLCTQYLGAQRNDPRIREGMGYLMARLPSENARNCYYWYYATQVMHNLPGYEWDEWNRKMRRILIESQAKQGCAAGSWDPLLPSKDTWSDTGGRIMMTSLCCLTLEVYYRYLPLYKLDAGDAAK